MIRLIVFSGFLLQFSFVVQSSVPLMNIENMRYMITADNWSENQVFKLQKFIVLGRKGLNVYTDREFNKNAFQIDKSKKFTYGNLKCEENIPNNILEFDSYIEANFECGYQYCDKLRTKENITKNLFSSPVRYLNNQKLNCNVPFIVSRFNYKTKSSVDMLKSTYTGVFIPVETFEKNSVASINWNGKSFFINLKECKEDDGCTIYDETEDLWHQQWNALIEIRNKKSLKNFNFLVDNLLPCVKNKDIKCVKKFFADKSDYQVLLGDFVRYGGNTEIVINDEVLLELEECLKYESIMPHFRSMKGKNKVCIPVRPLNYEEENYVPKIGSITFPEAVRVLESNDIIFIRR